MLTDETTTTATLGPDVELRLTGMITAESLPALSREFAEALQLRPEHVILNLRTCTGMEPDAIRLLLAAGTDAVAMGSQIVLHHPTPALVRSLAMAGVLRWLTIDYPDAALARGCTEAAVMGPDRGPLKTPVQRMAIRRFAGW